MPAGRVNAGETVPASTPRNGFLDLLFTAYTAGVTGDVSGSGDLPTLRFPDLPAGPLGPAISARADTQHWQQMLRGIPRLPRRRVVDFGGGAEHIRSSLSQLGYEWQGAAIRSGTRQRLDQDDDDGGHAPLDDGSAYIALCVQRLNHAADPREALDEVGRVLEPGGYLVGSVSQIEPAYPQASFTYAPEFFAEMLTEHGLIPLEVCAGIDGLTLFARRMARQYGAMADAAALNPFFEGASPLNRLIDEAGSKQEVDQRRVNLFKLEIAGQFHFMARKD